MQVYTGKSGEAREKKQGLQAVTDMACHMYGTGRGGTNDNFFTGCELAKFLLSKNMTVVGTLRINLKFQHYFSVELTSWTSL